MPGLLQYKSRVQINICYSFHQFKVNLKICFNNITEKAMSYRSQHKVVLSTEAFDFYSLRNMHQTLLF